MKWLLHLSLFFVLLNSISYPQKPGDFRSTQNNIWYSTCWEKFTGEKWIPATIQEITTLDTTRSYYIRHQINLNSGTPSAYNLYIDSIGTLVNTSGATCSFFLYHDLVCNGIIAADNGITLGVEGSDCKLSGSGKINFERIRKTQTKYNSIITISGNINVGTYLTSSAAALYNNVDGTILTVYIDSGYSVNFQNKSTSIPIYLAGASNTKGRSVRVIIKGSLNCDKFYFSNDNPSNLSSSITINNGGILSCNEIISPASDYGTTMTINEGGTLRLTGAGFTTFSDTNNTFNLYGTFEYAGAKQKIQPLTYSHLKLSGTDSITFQPGTTTIPANGSFELASLKPYKYSTGASLSVSPVNTTLVYSGSAKRTIDNEWTYNFSNLQLNNRNGLIINSSKNFPGSLTLQSGKIILGNNDLSFNSISGGSSESFVVTNGNGVLKSNLSDTQLFPVGADSISYTPITITNTSGTSDNISVQCTTSTGGVVNSDAVVNKQWTVTEDVAGGNNLKFLCQWNSTDEGSAFIRSNAEIGIKAGESFDLLPTSILSGDDPYFVESTMPLNLDYSSGKTIAVGNSEALPVELGPFTYNVNQNQVFLYWTTLTEKNSWGFEVERKNENSDWKKVAFISACCLSNSPKEYSFTDTVIKSGTYLYRLKMIDVDNSYQYSDIKSIIVAAPNTFQIMQNYPNPFNGLTNVTFLVPEGIHRVSLVIYDVLGNELMKVFDENVSSGIYEKSMDFSKFTSGVYLCRMQAGNFVKTIKMQLLK